MLSRKMFLETIILTIVAFLINIVYGILDVSAAVSSITSIVIALIMGATYYYMYRWSIYRKIRKYQRKGLTYEKQLEIAQKKGGDKITFSVILMFFADVALYIVLNTIGTIIL